MSRKRAAEGLRDVFFASPGTLEEPRLALQGLFPALERPGGASADTAHRCSWLGRKGKM